MPKDKTPLQINEVSVEEFTGLSPQEIAFIDLKIDLSEKIRKCRLARKWTQSDLAKAIGTSQSRVAMIEVTHSSVGFDLLIRALLALDISKEALSDMLTPPDATAPAAASKQRSSTSTTREAREKSARKTKRLVPA